MEFKNKCLVAITGEKKTKIKFTRYIRRQSIVFGKIKLLCTSGSSR